MYDMHELYNDLINHEEQEKILQRERARVRARARMPFGKHKGVLIMELPDDYLNWLQKWLSEDEYDGWFVDAVRMNGRIATAPWTGRRWHGSTPHRQGGCSPSVM